MHTSTISLKVKTRTTTRSEMQLVHTEYTSDNKPTLYIFNYTDSPGFVILSADDVGNPLLGFSDSEYFNIKDAPATIRAWIGQYSKQIEFAILSNAKSYKPMTQANWSAINPLITTQWNQDAPYNLQCPVINQKFCMAGCVATAMAQIMNYWKYPTQPQGKITYYPGKLQTPLSIDFSKRQIDWDQFQDTYLFDGDKYNYSEEQSEAIAYLLKACGYSVQMNYNLAVSGAVPFRIGEALIKNFCYNPNITYEERVFYTTSEWNRMIYNELAAGRPVIYDGWSDEGGHEFICDGYLGGDFFHINWGWGGLSDGYFQLQSLNPEEIGISSSYGGGFNYQQGATIGIQKEQTSNNKPNLSIQGVLSAYYNPSAKTLNLSFGEGMKMVNRTYLPITGSLGMLFENSSTGEKQFIPSLSSEIKLEANSGIESLSSNISSLPNGEYNVYPVILQSETQQIINARVHIGCKEYVVLKKTDNSATITNFTQQLLEIEEGGFSSPLYYGHTARVYVNVRNTSDIELRGVLGPVLEYDNKPHLKGDPISISLAPGESRIVEWLVNMSPFATSTAPGVDRNYILKFEDRNATKYYDFAKNVTLHIDYGNYDLSAEQMSIPGCETVMEKVATGKFEPVHLIKELNNLELTVKISNKGNGFFAQKCLIYWHTNYANTSVGSAVLKQQFIKPGETVNVNVPLSLKGSETDKTYDLNIYLIDKNGVYKQILDQSKSTHQMATTYFRIPSKNSTSGIIENTSKEKTLKITYSKELKQIYCSERCRQIEIYDVCGRRLASATNTDNILLPEFANGVITILGRSFDGRIASLKILE